VMNIDGAPASPRTTSFSYRRNISEKEREERKRNRMKQRKGKTRESKGKQRQTKLHYAAAACEVGTI